MPNPPLKQCLLSLCLLLFLFAEDAGASTLCFQRPAGVEGLQGNPAWMKGMGKAIRTDLNEPRWSSPLTHFASDWTGQEGAFRIQQNEEGTKLFVQIQTGADVGHPGPGDRVYFGISETHLTDKNSNPTARGVRIKVGSSQPTLNPKTAGLDIEGYTYDYAAKPKWTSSSGEPTWVENPAVWSKSPVVPVGSTVDWGVAFVVNLTALGITPKEGFRVIVALNVATDIGVSEFGVSDVYTPPPPAKGYSGNNPFVQGFPVESWERATPTVNACPGGVTLDPSQLTVSNDIGFGDDLVVVKSPGATNTFHAGVQTGSVYVPDNSLLAEFRIANWGTSYATAAWNPIVTSSGPADKVPNVSNLWEVGCDPNAGTKVCGLDPAPIGSQGIFARLNYAVGYNQTNLPIASGSAYRLMSFQTVSAGTGAFAARSPITARSPVAAKSQTVEKEQVEGVNVVRAEINTTGIDTGEDSNDIYLILHQRNLPEHGNQPVPILSHALDSSRRAYFAPLPQLEKKTKVAQSAQSKKGSLKKEMMLTRQEIQAALAIPTQVEKLDQMKEVWPHLEVQAYFDNRRQIKNDSGAYTGLVAMYPFTAFYEPKGEFYGYAQTFSLVEAASEGSEMEVLKRHHDGAPEVLHLTIPKGKTAQLEIRTELHREPLIGEDCVTEPVGPKKSPKTHTGKDAEKHVKSKPLCTYSPGGSSAPGPGLLIFGLLAGLSVRRRRRGRGSC